MISSDRPLRNNVLCSILFGVSFTVAVAAESKTPLSVTTDAISKGEVIVRGVLGKPLGTFVEIEAVVVKRVREFPYVPEVSYELRIEKIDGRVVEQQITAPFSVIGMTEIKVASSPSELEKLLAELQAGHRLRVDLTKQELTDAPPISAAEAEAIRRDYVGSRHKLVVFETAQFFGVPGDLPVDCGYLLAPGGFRFEAHLIVAAERKLN